MKRTPQSEAKAVMIALDMLGFDQKRAFDNPMVQEVCKQWVAGDLYTEQFENACKNLLILNTTLRKS